jgi:L-cysteine S-thiosulfotransferase
MAIRIRRSTVLMWFSRANLQRWLGVAPGALFGLALFGLAVGGLVFLPFMVASEAFAQAPKRFFDIPKSGVSFASEEIRKLQDDELGNPAQLLVDQAKVLWSQAPTQGKACEQCHGKIEALKGAATRYPKVLAKPGLINLEGRINLCRTDNQGQAAWPYESPQLLGLTALIASQSRGMSNQSSIEGPAKPHFEAGQLLYYERMGQMNLSCAHCHEKNAGRRLLAEVISQGHPNAYPIYRLEWQATGSLHRRFRSCLNGVKAELWPQGSSQFLSLELFLAWRGQGLGVETPGVRR